MKKGTTFWFMFVVVFAWGCTIGRADASGNIHLGKLGIHPYLSLQGIFSDNIYSTATDIKRDRIDVITPGAQLQFPFGMHRFEADYHAVLRRYDEFEGENTDDHHARGLVTFSIGSRFNLTLGDQFAKDHEARGSSATGFIDVFRSNAASSTATYQLAGRSKMEVGYRQTRYDYMIANFRDRDETLVTGAISYRFMPKTSVFIEFDRKIVDFEPVTTTLDNQVDYVMLGVTWEATAKSKGTVKGGRVNKDFESEAVDDFKLWGLFIDLDHQFTEYTSILLSVRRDVNETNLLGTTFFVTTGFAGEFKHRFGSKLTAMARFSYGDDEFSHAVPPQTQARIDKTVREGVGARYALREWFEIGADYGYRSRDSNIDVNDHREHQTIVSVKLTF